MMSGATLPGLVTQTKSMFANSGTSIFNGILIVITFGGESVFRKLSFKCPCSYPQSVIYGGAFLFAPASALFFLGLLLNNTTWRILHGCFYRSRRTRHGLKRSCYYWINVVAQACVAPCAWLFIAFLDGGYYECFKASDYCHMGTDQCARYWVTATGNSSVTGDPVMAALLSGGSDGCVDPNCICSLPSHKAGYLRARSQIIAWILLFVSITFMLSIMSCGRCLDRFTYNQNTFINLYRDIEETVLTEKSKEKAQALAETNVSAFFDKKFRTKLDWDTISVVPLSEFPDYLDYTGRGQKLRDRHEPYFSPLHEWAKDHIKIESRWKSMVPRLALPKSNSLPIVIDEEVEGVFVTSTENATPESGQSGPFLPPTTGFPPNGPKEA